MNDVALHCRPAARGGAGPVYRRLRTVSHLATDANLVAFPARGTTPGAGQTLIKLAWPAVVACPERTDGRALLCVPVSTGIPAPARNVVL
jgi:hypothetical protein